MKCSGYLLVVGFVGFGCFSAEDVPTPWFDKHVPGKDGGPSSTASGTGGAGGQGGAGGGSSTSSSSGGSGVQIMGQCGGQNISYVPMCEDDDTEDGDSCTSDCKCGIDGNMMLPPDVVDKATAFTVTGTESCYVWVETPKSWHKALSLCNQMGMHLAYFDSPMPQEDLAAVKPKLVNDMSMAMSTWVGALRQYPEQEDKDDFFWLNGEEVIKGALLWAPSQPDNYLEGTYKEDEDCAEILSWIDRLNDDTCTDEKSFLCESP